MTRKQKRTATIIGAMAILGFAAFLMFRVLGDTMVFFYTPSEIIEKSLKPGQTIGMGCALKGAQFMLCLAQHHHTARAKHHIVIQLLG